MTSGLSRSRSQYQSSMRTSPCAFNSVGRRGASGGGVFAMPVASRDVVPTESGLVVERIAGGAVVRVDGVVRATFVGDLDQPADKAALDELVSELFGGLLDRTVK